MSTGSAGRGSVAAVDLGASSGRVLIGRFDAGSLTVEEVHRFPNEPVQRPDGLRWDVRRLFDEVVEGLRRASRVEPHLRSVGVDSWAIDYGLLDADGGLLGDPYHYRDTRTAGIADRVHAVVTPERLYARTGIQFLPFNTIYQLAAARDTPELKSALTLLLVPDLMGYWLSGVRVAEITNASTTGLLDIHRQAWAVDVLAELGLAAGILPPLGRAGDRIGRLLPGVAEITGLSAAELTLVGSHDTASAVVAVPADDDEFAYISCGTWALVGLELAKPITTEASRAANFTNEAGVDGRVRYLRNVTGLWLLNESMRTWQREGPTPPLTELLQAAAALPPGGAIIDPNDPTFLAPGDMPARIADACRRDGQPVPDTAPAMVRCILESLATAFGSTVRDAMRLSGQPVRSVHMVGGGSSNDLLCQLTANACQLPVLAGPVEATAIGNMVVQARAHGLVEGDLAALRAVVRASQPLKVYEPQGQEVARA